MVVPIREVVNIFFFNLALSSTPFLMANLSSNMDIDINYNIIREKSASSSKTSSRASSVLSNILSALYYKQIDINNNLSDKDI